MKIKNIFLHFVLVCRHRHAVFRNCVRCGIPLRGLLHDLSKFSPSEFWESARFYQGNRSPIGACRRATGISRAWLHHKGRNKHHIEYWEDEECDVSPMMPYPYAVECLCDKIAATKTYLGKEYAPDKPLLHWRRYGCKVNANPKTLAFLERAFCDLAAQGEDFVLNRNYLKTVFREICGDGKRNQTY